MIMTGTFKKFTDSSFDNKLWLVILLVLSVFVLFSYSFSAFRSFVNADAGYYLGVTELIHKGYVPYRDFSLGYTPLFFYVLQVPRLFMGNYPAYTGYLLFLYLFAFLDAFLLATIIKRITNSKKIAWLTGLIFLILYYYFDGAYFILETFSLCCGLTAMVLLIEKNLSVWRCFLSGVCCAFAFLSKQYGLLFSGFIGVFVLASDVEWKKRILFCSQVFGGFFIVIILFVALYYFSGLEPKELVLSLSAGSYGDQSIKLYFEGVIKCCKLFLFLLFLPFLFVGKSFKNKNIIWACLTGLILATVQFYFNVFPHYFLFLLPFVLILFIILLQMLKRQYFSRLSFLLFIAIAFTSFVIPLQTVYKDTKSLVKHDLRASQEQTAERLRHVVQDYGIMSALCYWNTIQYYGLCPLTPSAITEYGFKFGSDTEESLIKRLKDADCFIVNKVNLDDIAEMTELSKTLVEGFILLDEVFADGTIVFVRTK